jgi:hypothetical protein
MTLVKSLYNSLKQKYLINLNLNFYVFGYQITELDHDLDRRLEPDPDLQNIWIRLLIH